MDLKKKIAQRKLIVEETSIRFLNKLWISYKRYFK